jgi:hypothetical protein
MPVFSLLRRDLCWPHNGWRQQMAWFRNHYACARCGRAWSDEWSATCDDDCPGCGARHMSPISSDDLSERIEEHDGAFLAWRSDDRAGDQPLYVLVGSFDTRESAEAAFRGRP